MSKDNFSPDDDYEDGDELINDDDEPFFDLCKDEARVKMALEAKKQKETRTRLETLLEERRLRKEIDDWESYDIDD